MLFKPKKTARASTPTQRLAGQRNWHLVVVTGAKGNLSRILSTEFDWGIQCAVESVVKQLDILEHLMREKYKRRKE